MYYNNCVFVEPSKWRLLGFGPVLRLPGCERESDSLSVQSHSQRGRRRHLTTRWLLQYLLFALLSLHVVSLAMRWPINNNNKNIYH